MAEGNGKAIRKNDRADIQVDTPTTARVVESIVLRGDISALNSEERSRFYVQICRSLGLTPAALPFAILRLNGKEILYPTRAATDQLAAIHRLNREIIDGPRVIDMAGTKLVYAVCRATHPNGRIETAVATVPLSDPLNAMMKAETKAKRRATLSILGLGMLDESEVETIPGHQKSPGPTVDVTGGPSAAVWPDQSGNGNDLTEADSTPPELELFFTSVEQIEMPGESVALWIKHRNGIALLGPAAGQKAWKALCTRTEEVGRMKNAKVWLKRAIAEEDARTMAPEPDWGPESVSLDADDSQVDAGVNVERAPETATKRRRNGVLRDAPVPDVVRDDLQSLGVKMNSDGSIHFDSRITLEQAVAILLSREDSLIPEDRLGAEAALRDALVVDISGTEFRRALDFERWRVRIQAATTLETLREVHASINTAVKFNNGNNPWKTKEGQGYIARITELLAVRKAKLTPPDPPNGGGAPKPPAPVASEEDPERAAIAAEGHTENNQFAQTKAPSPIASAPAGEKDRLLKHLLTCRSPEHIANSVLAHVANYALSEGAQVDVGVRAMALMFNKTSTQAGNVFKKARHGRGKRAA